MMRGHENHNIDDIFEKQTLGSTDSDQNLYAHNFINT